MRARAACTGSRGVRTWALTCCTCRGPRQSELLTDEKLAEFNEAFDLFDKKKEGKIPSADLISVFQAMKLNISKREEREYLSVQCTPAPPCSAAADQLRSGQACCGPWARVWVCLQCVRTRMLTVLSRTRQLAPKASSFDPPAVHRWISSKQLQTVVKA